METRWHARAWFYEIAFVYYKFLEVVFFFLCLREFVAHFQKPRLPQQEWQSALLGWLGNALTSHAGQQSPHNGSIQQSQTLPQAEEMWWYIVMRPRNTRFLGFIGGVALALTWIQTLFQLEILVDPLAYLVNVFHLALSLVICVVDGQEDWLPDLCETIA